MLGVGIFLMIALGLISLIVGIAYFLECWRCSQIYTMFATVLPFVGTVLLVGLLLLAVFTESRGLAALAMVLNLILIVLTPVAFVFHILLLVKYWAELRNLFFAQLLVGFLLVIPAVIVGAEMATRAEEMMAQEQAEEIQRIEDQIASENQQRRMEHERRLAEQRNQRQNNQRNNYANNTPPPPPPRPDEPIFEPGQLIAGMRTASAAIESWPTLTVPDLDLSKEKALDLHGYRLRVPDIYKIQRVEPMSQGNGMQWTIVGGQHDNGRPVELKVRITELPRQADGRVFEPSWSEALGQAGVSRTDYRVEYGRIGTIPFARCANKLVKSGHGVGQVRYLGKPSPQNPQRIEIDFATDPQGFGRAHALTCEAIVRSMTRIDRVMMPDLTDAASLSSPLATTPTTEISPEDWQVRGPFALSISDPSKATCSPWSRDGQAWQTTARFGGLADYGITIRLQPDDEIPQDRIRPIALQGPLRADSAVCAFGGEASYVKLWEDAVFARIEHTSLREGDASSHRRVSYHGYFNQYRLDISLTNRDDSAVTMAELEDTLMRSRLAAVPELAEGNAQSDWLKEVLAEDQPAFLVAGGVDAKQALLLDERGQIEVSPQYDPKSQQMFAVYPELGDIETLADYEQWTSDESHADRLGRAETLDEIVIQPIKELRASHRSKQLSWQTKTKAGMVGMTVHVEALKESDRDIQTPIVEVDGRLRIRLGRRVIQPSQTPEVSYREHRNLRIWRVNVPANARQQIARCHYLALVPDKMIVISTSYHADRPEQLDAFDASVATLVYKDGEALMHDAAAE